MARGPDAPDGPGCPLIFRAKGVDSRAAPGPVTPCGMASIGIANESADSNATGFETLARLIREQHDMRAFLLILSLGMVAACGGGGLSPPGERPPVDANPGGLWVGTLTYEDQTVEELVGLSTADGFFTLISFDTFGPDTVGQYIGVFDVNGTTVTGSGTAYATQGAAWSNNSAVLDFSVSATIDEQTSLVGEMTANDIDLGSFELEYDTDYERDSALPLLQGVWYVYDDTLNAELTLTAQGGGAFAAQSDTGCQSSGQISVIDGRFNIYGWSVRISSCTIAGDYAGYAVLGDIDTGDPAASQNNALLVSISNDVRALLLPLER